MANDVIIDELLCFVSNAIDTLPGENLIASCTAAFNVTDIRQSKLRFFTRCKRLSSDTDIPNGGIKHIARRSESPVNDIKDIIKLFQELGEQAPRFAALNLRNIPQVLSVANPDVNKLVLALDSLKAEVSALKAVVDIQLTLQEAMKDQLNSRPSYACITKEPRAPHTNLQKSPPIGETVNAPPAKRAVSNNARDSDGNDKGWERQKRRKKRPFKMGTKQAPNGGDSIRNPKLVGVKSIKTAHVFVTRLPHDCEADDVKQFIKENLQLDATVEKVRTGRSSSDISSFHVACQCDDPKIFFDPLLWPEHCLYRRWWPARNNKVRPDNTSGDSNSVNDGNSHGGE